MRLFINHETWQVSRSGVQSATSGLGGGLSLSLSLSFSLWCDFLVHPGVCFFGLTALALEVACATCLCHRRDRGLQPEGESPRILGCGDWRNLEGTESEGCQMMSTPFWGQTRREVTTPPAEDSESGSDLLAAARTAADAARGPRDQGSLG